MLPPANHTLRRTFLTSFIILSMRKMVEAPGKSLERRAGILLLGS